MVVVNSASIPREADMNEDAKKRLRLMTFWLFGTVVIVWAAVATYAYVHFNNWSYVLESTWSTMLVTIIGAVAVYLIYRYVILPRSEK
jgi:uncharacterized membrane protein